MTPILYHRRKTGLHRHDVGSQRRIAGVICRIGRLHWTSASVCHGIAGLNDSPKDRRAGWTGGMESNT